MGATVRLEVAGTIVPARTLVFRAPAALSAGRAEDCGLRVAADDRRVSRRHCVFDIDPPAVRVRDLGSRNGTYVNGVRLAPCASRPHELADGDEVRLGGAVVGVFSTGTGARTAQDRPRPAGAARIGDHTLVRELGRGTQAVVHLARHEPSGELRALKVLRPEAVLRPELVHGFLREIRTTRTLRHPRLVAFHEAGAVGTWFFLAGEYCDGGSLAQWMAGREGPLTPETAVAVTLQVLDGLEYLHDRRTADATGPQAAVPDRLVHRDLKPQNILLTGSRTAPSVKIADFGLAKAFERAGLSGHTLTGALGGSVPFMPRSQIVNYKYAGPAVDVWSATACLYWMLTGTTPRDFPDGADPVGVVLREPVVPVLRRTSAVPRRLATLLDGVLADEDPGSRTMPSARELGQALREVL
ncbi:protein kinase domain-containing protein [Streptomyces rubradiris]|uniref:protein kinase domain-containing protein n=1 Tax=Streptomyces rubradiris TaxID=285531 RepID=UPI00167A9D10|nr:FHA domain-containing serine/threonine-protein kinase [Streptomyces rubradiris]